MSTTFDPNKPYAYRCGEPARMLCKDAPGPFPFVTLTKDGAPMTHAKDGSLWGDGEKADYDLVNTPAEFCHERWVNVDRDGKCEIYRSKKLADEWRDTDRIACIRIEIRGKEGDGL